MDQLSSYWVLMLVGAGVYVLICGGFGAYVANEKGRSGLEGFLFGFLLGPIGVVAAACLPDQDRGPGVPAYQDAGILNAREEEDDKVRDALARMEQKAPPVANQAGRLLGEVEEPKPRRPKAIK